MDSSHRSLGFFRKGDYTNKCRQSIYSKYLQSIYVGTSWYFYTLFLFFYDPTCRHNSTKPSMTKSSVKTNVAFDRWWPGAGCANKKEPRFRVDQSSQKGWFQILIFLHMLFFQKWSFWLRSWELFAGISRNISGIITFFLMGKLKRVSADCSWKNHRHISVGFPVKTLKQVRTFYSKIPKKLVDCYRISASTMSRKRRKTPQGVWSTLSRPHGDFIHWEVQNLLTRKRERGGAEWYAHGMQILRGTNGIFTNMNEIFLW